jgi:hypothetical protein
MENISEIMTVIWIIAGIFSLILFCKIWRMTDDINELKYHMRAIRRLVNKNPNYLYGHDTSYDSFLKDIEEIEELMYCEQSAEARFRLRKLMYNLNKAKQADLESGYPSKYDWDKMEKRLNELEKQLPKQS